MKKAIVSILLIALCCTAAFAADVSAKVVLSATAGTEGFSFKTNEGLWEPQLAFNVNGDKSGATFKVALVNFEKLLTEYQIWSKPKDHIKLTLGAYATNSFKGGFEFSDVMGYGKGEIFEDQDNKDAKNYRRSYAFGFGFQPKLTETAKDAKVFLTAELNQGVEEKDYVHADTLFKIDFANGKADIDYAFAELAYFKAYKFQKEAIENNFGLGDEERYNEYRSNNDLYYNDWFMAPGYSDGNIGVLALRYKYYADDAKKNDGGLLAYGFTQILDKTAKTTAFEGEMEVGRYGTDMNFGVRFYKTEDGNYEKARFLAKAEFDWGDGNIDSRLSESYGFLKKNIESKEEGKADKDLKAEYNFYNKAENTAAQNGFFVKSTVAFPNVGNAAYSASLDFGFDYLKKSHWNVGLKSTLAY